MEESLKINLNEDREITLNYKKLRKSVLILRAINHDLRLEIIKLLNEQEELTVTDIYVKLRVEQSVASQHLAILRKANVVVTDRKGKFIYYRLNTKRLNEIYTFVEELAQ